MAEDRSTPRGKIIVANAKGRTGKSTELRYLYETTILAGRPVVLADFDRNNSTISSFYPEARRPISADDATMTAMLEDVANQAISDKVPVLLDTGGGDRFFATAAERMKLFDILPKHGVDIVMLFFAVGARDDFENLARMQALGFNSPMTLLVLNEGLAGIVPEGEDPFGLLLAGKTVTTARKAHARVLRMPRLPLWTMNLADNLFIGHRAAAAGDVPYKDGQPHPDAQPLNIWRRAELSDWLEEMDKRHHGAGILDWLP